MTSFPLHLKMTPGPVDPSSLAAQDTRKVGFYMAEPTGRILEANDVFLVMIGATKEALAQGQLSCRGIMREESYRHLEQAVSLLEKQGYIEPFETRFCSLSGSEFSGLVSVTALRDGSGCGAFLIQDITGQKQSRGIMESIFQETSDMIAAVDTQLRYIAFNQAYQLEMEKKYGISFELGDKVSKALAHFQEEQAAIVDAFERALRGEEFTLFIEAGPEHQERYYYEITFGAIEDNGQIIGAFHVARNRTAQRRLEEEQAQAQAEILRLNEDLQKRFDVTFEQAAVGIAHVGVNGDFLRINKKYCEILGYAREEIPGLTFAMVTHPDERERDLALHQKLIGGEVQNISRDKRYIRKDGSTVWVHLTVAAVRNVEGQLDYNLVVVEDITERKQAEEALRESEERFRILANASPSQIFDVALDGTLRFINKTTLEFYGPAKEQEILAGGWINYVHPDDLEKVSSSVPIGEREHPDISTIEFRIRRHDGEYRWVLASTAPSFYPSGEMYGLVGTAIDITDRKQMEVALQESKDRWQELANALQESKDRWQELANAVPLTIWVANAKGEVIFVNARWYEYSGLTPDQSLGNAGMDAVHPDDQKWAGGLWAEYIQRGELYEVEVRYRNAAGDYRWHIVRAVPVKDADGHVLNWYGTCIDIQDRRKMEQELSKARDIAEDANRKKSQFLANMSHELRTPLNAVIGFSDMLKKGMAGPLTVKQNNYVDHISTSGRHLLTMVNDILDISKAEAGRIEIFLQYITLEPFIKQLNELVSYSANKEQIQVSFEVQPDLSGFIADPDRLKQIFLNLLSNAIKFNNEGGSVQVFISRSADNQWVVCEIQDTGIGIPQDKIQNLCSEFYQVDSSNSRRYEGTGLGLALTKKLIDLHHGEISVESQEGVGSTFTFKLPLNPYAALLQPEVTSSPIA